MKTPFLIEFRQRAADLVAYRKILFREHDYNSRDTHQDATRDLFLEMKRQRARRYRQGLVKHCIFMSSFDKKSAARRLYEKYKRILAAR